MGDIWGKLSGEIVFGDRKEFRENGNSTEDGL